jgi:hypothetical protein
MDLGMILDALEGRRGPLDFETLKDDLRKLGANLRLGFEEAKQNFQKQTQRLNQQTAPPAPALQPLPLPNFTREINKAAKKVKAAHARKYSLQRATLSIFSGGAMMAAWGVLLNAADNSGLLESIERIILAETHAPLVGLVPVMRLLWVLGLIPVARGVAHLLNGLFFAPQPEPELAEQYTPAAIQPPPAYVSPVADVPTNELVNEPQPQPSVTEDATLRFAAREAAREMK